MRLLVPLLCLLCFALTVFAHEDDEHSTVASAEQGSGTESSRQDEEDTREAEHEYGSGQEDDDEDSDVGQDDDDEDSKNDNDESAASSEDDTAAEDDDTASAEESTGDDVVDENTEEADEEKSEKEEDDDEEDSTAEVDMNNRTPPNENDPADPIHPADAILERARATQRRNEDPPMGKPGGMKNSTGPRPHKPKPPMPYPHSSNMTKPYPHPSNMTRPEIPKRNLMSLLPVLVKAKACVLLGCHGNLIGSMQIFWLNLCQIYSHPGVSDACVESCVKRVRGEDGKIVGRIHKEIRAVLEKECGKDGGGKPKPK